MTDEKLIEDAKRVMAEADGQDMKRMDAHTLEFMYGGQARAALAVFEKAHTPTAGSCWDAAPRVVREGECDPMPTLCELTAGHTGAHRSGQTEWMHSRPHTPTDDEREAVITALLDELGWEWDEVPEEHIPSSRVILGDMADRVLAVSAGFRHSKVPEPQIECPHWSPGRITLRKGCTACEASSETPEPSAAKKLNWPDHWTLNEKIRDLHARWHDQAGNLIEVCGWEGCEFWEAAKFTLRMADVRVIGREPQGEPSDAQDDSERSAAYRREHRAELMRQERAALRAAGGERR